MRLKLRIERIGEKKKRKGILRLDDGREWGGGSKRLKEKKDKGELQCQVLRLMEQGNRDGQTTALRALKYFISP